MPEIEGITDGSLHQLWLGKLANDVLEQASKQCHSLEMLREQDGTVRIVSTPPRFLAIDCQLLESPGLIGITFDNGIMTIEDDHGTSARYAPLMTINYYTAVLFEKVEE